MSDVGCLMSDVITIPRKMSVLVAQAILPVRPLVNAHRQDCRCHHSLKRYSFMETVSDKRQPLQHPTSHIKHPKSPHGFFLVSCSLGG